MTLPPPPSTPGYAALAQLLDAVAQSPPLAELGEHILDAACRLVHADTLATLRQRYGAANVKEATLDGAEGETLPGIVLYDGDPARRLEVIPGDGVNGIGALRVGGASSRWRIDNGVRLGMPLAELVALNGKPITFTGLGWDYGGGITDWHGGKLAPAENAPVFRSLTLSTCEGVEADGERDYPQGEGEVRSDDAHYPKLGKVLCVGQLMVSFATP